jgi:hypothetical protein
MYVDEALVEAMVRSESLVAKDEEAVLEALLSWMSVGSHAPLSLRGEKLARHIRFGTIQVSACASQSLSPSLCLTVSVSQSLSLWLWLWLWLWL